jgi:RNA polymerase sigma factor (sigma-70 family)
MCPHPAEEKARFEDFYREWRAYVREVAVRYVCCREDAEEAADDAFLRVWRDGFWRKIRNPRAYLAVAARWAASRMRTRPTVALTRAAASRLVAPHPLPDELTAHRERRRALEEAISRLPERCAIVMGMVRQGLSHRKIALRLGISTKGVEKQAARGRRLLAQRMSPFEDGGGRGRCAFLPL